ncbi:MAG: hypothetical protein AB1643_02340 [Patescibacteria group bacterium]
MNKISKPTKIILIVLSIISVLWLYSDKLPSRIPCSVITFSDYLQQSQKIAIYNTINGILDAASVIFIIISALIFSILIFKKIKRKILIIALMITALLIVSFLLLTSLNTGGPRSPDSTRIADIKQVQLALELYYDEFHSYPPVKEYTELEKFLKPKFIAQLPSDICAEENLEHQYKYANSPDDNSYILRAILTESKNIALNQDIDGEIFGIFCGEQGKEIEYCVSP